MIKIVKGSPETIHNGVAVSGLYYKIEMGDGTFVHVCDILTEGVWFMRLNGDELVKERPLNDVELESFRDRMEELGRKK